MIEASELNNKSIAEAIKEEYINSKYFHVLLENSIVSKSDLEGRITYINDNFTKTTGFTKEECLGKKHNILRHPSNPIEIFQDLWNTIQSGKVWRERVLNKNKDGTDFWAETTIIPLQDDYTGEILEYIAIRRDITEFLMVQRQAQKEKIEKEEQEKISKAKENFLVLFTHELKTPLNAIINFSKYLSKHLNAGTIEKVEVKKRKKLLDQITINAEYMLEEIMQLLELSKIKSDKLQYCTEDFNIIATIENVLKKHQNLANENKTKIKKYFDDTEVTVFNDPYRVAQIISNILSNAIKYSYGIVHVHLHVNEKNFEISIQDNGNGIQDKEKAMELFEQTEGDIKTRYQKGTGIGLNFVKRLCEDLDIEYKLGDSAELGGLDFRIILKRK